MESQVKTDRPVGRIARSIKNVFSLLKVIVIASLVFTTFTGYVLADGPLNAGCVITLVGVFLLGAGAAVFNQAYERKTDALMPRTAKRLMASGRVSLQTGLIVGTLHVAAGLAILYFHDGWFVAALGLFNLVWYNLVYTPLKRVSSWALIAGTVAGVIPLLMGFSAAGESLLSNTVIFVAFFMVIWQIPHFLILLVKYGKEYEQAGLASITAFLHEEQILRLAYLWVVATAASTLFIPLLVPLHHRSTSYAILAIVVVVLVSIAIDVYQKEGKRNIFRLFMLTNLMQTGFMLCLVVDSLL
jgi:Polyprenyltransferase (cytochrome oxidase assembly factor)